MRTDKPHYADNYEKPYYPETPQDADSNACGPTIEMPASAQNEETPGQVPGGVAPESVGAVGGRDVLIGVAIIWFVELIMGAALVIHTGLPPVFENHPVALLVVSLLSGAVTLLVAWIFVCRKYGRSFTEGFLLTPLAPRALLAAIALGAFMAVAGGLLADRYSTGDHLFSRVMETPAGLAALVIMILLLPIVEEVYYRGFLYPAFRKMAGAPAAIVIVTIWFAAAHTMQSLDDWVVIPIVGAVGAVFTLQRWYTGSITTPLITHLTYNFSLILLTLASQYLF